MAEDMEFREISQTCVEWKIKKFFNLCSDVEYYLDSPPFSLSGMMWRIQICPNGESKQMALGWIGLHVWKEYSAVEHCAALRIGIKRADGSVFEAIESKQEIPKEAHAWGRSKYLERFVLLRSMDSMVPDGTLTVYCSVRIMDDRSSTTEVESQTLSSLTSTVESSSQTALFEEPLLKDFKKLYISRRCTDVTLIVRNKEFYAHRIILVARSPVFASMFEHETSERKTGSVKISDCDPDSFEEFLLFLYTGKLDDVSLKKALDLYQTSHKYDVKELKEKCVHIMRRDLCTEFFCDVTYLAMMHTELGLLNDATNFFIDNADTILPTTKWQQFLDENSLLCNELLLNLVKNKK